MSNKGTFNIISWQEESYADVNEGAKLTQARVTQSYKGVIDGEGSVEYLMVSPDDAATSFVGLERITGSVGGRTGSFVIQHTGTYADGTARSDWVVVNGAGSGDLKNLRGKGSYSAEQGQDGMLIFDYELE